MRVGWNHNLAYHDTVLRCVPERCGQALDVGCGEGALVRKLMTRCAFVVGIDLDLRSLAVSSGEEAFPAKATFLEGDVMTYPFAPACFDFIAAVAALHHLPLEGGLQRLKGLLAPGGVLVVIGLYRAESAMDSVYAAAALPVSRMLRISRGWTDVQAATRMPRESLAEIRNVASRVLPGMALVRRLFFRYSLVWRSPGVRARDERRVHPLY